MQLRRFLNRTEMLVEDVLFGGRRVRAAETRLHHADQEAEDVMEEATKTIIEVKTAKKKKPNGVP